jgi:hypothetical protein
MSIMQQAVEGPGYRLIKGRRGPLTAARQARALIVLALVYAVGLGLFWGVEAAGWRAFGLGLLVPGGGFVALGGWLSALFPLTFAIFLLGVFVWFASGMVVLPPAIWLGAAAISGLLARDGAIWNPAAWVVLAFSAAVAVYFWSRSRGRKAESLAKFERRAAFLPRTISAACAIRSIARSSRSTASAASTRSTSSSPLHTVTRSTIWAMGWRRSRRITCRISTAT